MEAQTATGYIALNNRFAFSSLFSAVQEETSEAATELMPNRLLHKDCHLHYWLSGPRMAPLVVCIHAEGADHHSFDALAQRLARSYRVLTWDMRGHGQSKSDRLFSLEQAVDDLQVILRREGYSSGILIGMSVGGLVAQHYAQRFSDSVLGLALLSCRPLNRPLSSSSRFFGLLSAYFLRMMPYWFVLAQMPAHFSIRPEVQKYMAEAMQESGKEQFLAAWQVTTQATVIEVDRTLPQPLLVALGAYDRPQWLGQTTALWSQASPGMRIVSVPGAGHTVMQDNPAFSYQMLSDFCGQCVRERRHSLIDSSLSDV